MGVYERCVYVRVCVCILCVGDRGCPSRSRCVHLRICACLYACVLVCTRMCVMSVCVYGVYVRRKALLVKGTGGALVEPFKIKACVCACIVCLYVNVWYVDVDV